ncbi:MAG: ATP-binding protein [Bacteroidales bacterium]
MKRKIISINEELCNGCGKCVKGCHEGALQMIDGKARIISELYCDGLGACIGDCPVGAISIEEREALPYDEIAVMEKISPKGEQTILAHLNHLKDHNELAYLEQGIAYIKKHQLNVNLSALETQESLKPLACGCPGSAARSFKPAAAVKPQFKTQEKQVSELTHWPVQLHLINPSASYLNGADLLVAADCTAFAYADFHATFIKGKKLVIACPKLDSNKEVYVAKLTEMINESMVNTLTVIIMQVPCCKGLTQLVQLAVSQASRKIPVKEIIISVQGEIVKEEWI